MITNFQINKVLYFLSNAENKSLPLLKLFKLLYIHDMYCQLEHGIIAKEQYFVSELGPIPSEFWNEIEEGKFNKKFKDSITLFTGGKKITINNIRHFVIILKNDAKLAFDRELIKKAEFTALENIWFIYKDTNTSNIQESLMLGQSYWKKFIETGFFGKEIIINHVVRKKI